jgi:predicted TPR repeat methyltransferase
MTGKQKKEAVQLAATHLAADKFPNAQSLCEQILAADPNYAEAHFTLGWVHHRAGQVPQAIDSFAKAVDANRSDARYHNGKALALTAAGRLDEAFASFHKAIDLQPGYAEAHANLAKALWLAGKPDNAAQAYQSALRYAPNFAEIHNNFGTFLRQRKKYDQAVAEHLQAIKLNPKFALAYYNLAIDLAKRRQFEPAVAVARKALELRPDYAPTELVVARCLSQLHRIDEAIPHFDRILQRYPHHIPTRLIYSDALHVAGRREQAIAQCQLVQNLAPGWDEIELRLAILTGRATLMTLPESFVIGLFDEYADAFDEHLVGALQYQAPQLMYAAVSPLVGGRKLDIMDLGCGTGLCGVLFKPLAASLSGVDLSPKMIERAQERGLYDHLAVADITAALSKYQAAFDLLLAADVFIYVGALEGVFTAAAAALRPNSLFAFTVETADGDGFVLQSSYRYAHSLSYLRKLAATHGFSEEIVRPAVLRKEGQGQINGHIIVLRKPAAL